MSRANVVSKVDRRLLYRGRYVSVSAWQDAPVRIDYVTSYALLSIDGARRLYNELGEALVAFDRLTQDIEGGAI